MARPIPREAPVTRAVLPLSLLMSSRVHSTIDGKIGARDVRAVGTCYESHHRGDIINMSITVERRGRLLRYRPVSCRRVQVRVDRARLDVVDGDAAATDLSGQSLREHLH